ncbi:MAG: carboxypeptidase regulatory-like domain-containing protein [Desulfobacterales bacterium]|nr:carboxypeptidase regulatory-like domain-containing protein [Desulfobacterales bacterium]
MEMIDMMKSGARTICILFFLFLIAGRGGAEPEPFAPMQLGDLMRYTRSDGDDNSWTVTVRIVEETTLGSNTFFHYLATNYNPGHLDDMYVRSTSDTVYKWDEEYEKEEILFQTGPVGSSWTRGTGETTVTTIISAGGEVTTPYGGPFTTWCYRLKTDDNPYTYVWLAEGLGIVKVVDYWVANPPKISLLIEVDVMHTPAEFGPDSASITNRYTPMKTGDKKTMTGYGNERNKSYVWEAEGEETASGVHCLKLHLKDMVNGVVEGDDRLWLAQDVNGDVWILKHHDALTGEVNEHGISSSHPVLWMPVHPEAGRIFMELKDSYYQVAATGAASPRLNSGAGPFEDCLKVVSHYSATDIDTQWFAPGVGLVLDDYRDTESQAPVGYELTEHLWGSPGGFTRMQGTISSDATGVGIGGAVISLDPGGYTFVTSSDGTYTSTLTPPGSYTAQISALHYEVETVADASVTPGVVGVLNAKLTPLAPRVSEGAARPDALYNDFSSTSLLTVKATRSDDPDGAAGIASVTADLSELGGSETQAMYDDGSHGDVAGGDGVYSYNTRARDDAAARPHVLNITATDRRGFRGVGTIPVDVFERETAFALASLGLDLFFNNELAGQTLRVIYTLTSRRTAAARAADGCYVELTIYKPDGSVHDVYPVTDSIDITIDGAEEGVWQYTTQNHCDRAVNFEIETRGSGAGMIAGRVVDAYTGEGVAGARVVCDAGGSTRTMAGGYYAGAAAAGVGAVRVTREGYQVHVKVGVVITAGQTTRLDHNLNPENAEEQPAPEGRNVHEILAPSDNPNPETQPAAAKVSDGSLEINVLFPPRRQPLDLIIALAVDYPGLSGAVQFFGQNNNLLPLSSPLPTWREGVSGEQSAQLLPHIPVSALPPAAYTLYTLATPDSSTLADYDLIFFTFTLGQAPPTGQNAVTIDAPADTPHPVNQPMAVKETDGNLEISVYFPPQQEPVTIYLTRQGPGPSGNRHILNSDNQWVESAEALLPWREEIQTKQACVVFSEPLADAAPGVYTFSSMVTAATDPLSNYSLIVFTKTVGAPAASPADFID